MSKSLRMRVVEAGARAIAKQNAGWTVAAAHDDAVAALDAMLDCLAESGVEWRRQAYDDPYYDNIGSDIPALLEVLREDR